MSTNKKSPKKSDLKQYFKPGENELLVKGVNTLPGPAGLLGAWKIELESGEVFFGDTSHTWLTSNDKTNWASVQNLGKNGCAPWGVVSASGRSNNKTRSPFDCAVVSQGRFTLPEVKSNQRVFYAADRVEGEPAARVHVNNTDAGGFIGAPYLLDITPFVKPGVNTIQTEPFKIEGGRIVIL